MLLCSDRISSGLKSPILHFPQARFAISPPMEHTKFRSYTSVGPLRKLSISTSQVPLFPRHPPTKMLITRDQPPARYQMQQKKAKISLVFVWANKRKQYKIPLLIQTCGVLLFLFFTFIPLPPILALATLPSFFLHFFLFPSRLQDWSIEILPPSV